MHHKEGEFTNVLLVPPVVCKGKKSPFPVVILLLLSSSDRELTRPLDLKVPPRCPEVADLGARRGLQRPAAAAGAEAQRAAVRRQEAGGLVIVETVFVKAGS